MGKTGWGEVLGVDFKAKILISIDKIQLAD